MPGISSHTALSQRLLVLEGATCGGKRLISRDIEIGEAQRADYEKVAEMHYPVWLESYTGIIVPYLLDIFVKHRADNEYPQRVSEGLTIMLAESDGKAVGVIIFGPQPGSPDHLKIDALYIKREDQRRGIGGVLLDKGSRLTALS